MTVPWEVVVASNELEDRRALAHILEAQDVEPICCATLSEVMQVLQKEPVGLIFCSKQFADGSYRDLLAAIRQLKQRTRVVLTSRHADWDEYLEAMRLGAFDAIASPCRPTDVEWMVIQAKRDERNRSRQPAPVGSFPANYRQASAGGAF